MLVIIGLIIGGILVGQDLIKAAELSSQISQINRYVAASATFQTKYSVLAGDMPGSLAAQNDFVARAGSQGRGDGNGVIEGYDYSGNVVWNVSFLGEPSFFWEDLTSSALTDQGLSTAIDAQAPVACCAINDPSPYIPRAKLNGMYLQVFSLNGLNYFSLARVTQLVGNNGDRTAGPGLSVLQASSIDSKIDDGAPASGKVQTLYYTNPALVSSPNAASANSSTCFDTTTYQYSIAVNGGRGVNCALSIQF